MPIRLYHYPRTRATRVLWLLEEIGAPYELTLIEDWDDRKSPEHLARHPLGRVPVIEEDGGAVFESAAICLHLADLHPDAGLIPPVGTHERALVYQWTLFAMTELEAGILAVFAMRDVDAQKAEARAEGLREAVQAVEDALDGREYLVGGRFTVADLVVAAVLLYARGSELLGDRFPRVAAYLERADERPARQRAVAVGAPAPA